MKRTGTILVAIAVVIALAAVPLGAAGALGTHGEQAQADDERANESVEPGEQLAGVVGVQGAEIDGEVSERTYGVKVANAATNESKADVVGDQLADVEERLGEHEATLEEIREARETGEMSEGQYRAKVATIAAETATTERMAEHANATAGELPAELLEERGINVEAIQELRQNASELGGPETAEIARSIAGDNVGQPAVADREPGAPIDVPAGNETPAGGADAGEDRPGNETDHGGEQNESEQAEIEVDRAAEIEIEQAELEIDRAAERIEQADDRVDDTDEDALDALEEARDLLNESEAALQEAQDVASDDAESALDHATEAVDRAEAAIERAEEAIDRSGSDEFEESDRGTENSSSGR